MSIVIFALLSVILITLWIKVLNPFGEEKKRTVNQEELWGFHDSKKEASKRSYGDVISRGVFEETKQHEQCGWEIVHFDNAEYLFYSYCGETSKTKLFLDRNDLQEYAAAFVSGSVTEDESWFFSKLTKEEQETLKKRFVKADLL